MKEKKKKISLTTQIFAALILGCLCGVLMHYVVPSGYVKDTVFVNGIFYVVGNGFIRLMKMLGSSTSILFIGMRKYGNG